MNSLTVVARDAAALRVNVTQDEIAVTLVDGRVLSVPVTWYPRLSHRTKEERNTCELMGRGTGVHWPLLEEDISVSGLLRGTPSFESEQSLQQWLDERASRNEKSHYGPSTRLPNTAAR